MQIFSKSWKKTEPAETYWFSRGVLLGAVVINADEKIQLLTQSLEMKARHSNLF